MSSVPVLTLKSLHHHATTECPIGCRAIVAQPFSLARLAFDDGTSTGHTWGIIFAVACV